MVLDHIMDRYYDRDYRQYAEAQDNEDNVHGSSLSLILFTGSRQRHSRVPRPLFAPKNTSRH